MYTPKVLRGEGLPIEAELYHPIEYIELKKESQAFLDRVLEKEKGGITSQLLIGHVVTFVSTHGLEALESQRYFKPWFVDDIKSKFKKKGIDLERSKEHNVDFEKMSVLSDNKSLFQSNDEFAKTANIFASSNYTMFHFLPFNRTVSRTHVQSLVSSIKTNGITSHPLVIYTDCVDGEWKYWIVDGQHRFTAFRQIGLPIFFTLYKKQSEGDVTMEDLVRLVAQINNTSKKWTVGQYLKAWVDLKIPDYIHIDRKYKETKIAMSVIITAYSSFSRARAVERFTDGRFKIYDKALGDRCVDFLYKIKGFVPKRSTFQAAIIVDCAAYSKEEDEAMIKKLKEVGYSYNFGESMEEGLTALREIRKLACPR